MLNKENYVPWSSRLLHYAKSRPNGKLIYNSIINGPYVRRMIPKPGDLNCEVLVNETFHVQTDDKLTEKELKQIEADDQAIHIILLAATSPMRKDAVTLIISSTVFGILSWRRLMSLGFVIPCTNLEILMHYGAPLTSLLSSLYLLMKSSVDFPSCCLML
uniref:Uncharacterized protein n=1 Tax=Tanacetum cinerariifolium TaxID=118510 RepID=A0A6L2P5Z3_TANCI|nr:hypothetical protein [Tanacetum cinerariifolium]